MEGNDYHKNLFLFYAWWGILNANNSLIALSQLKGYILHKHGYNIVNSG